MKRNTDNMEIKRRSTFAILFYINRTKIRKDGTCQLLCKISIDAKWEQIGTKVSVNPAVWNPEKGRADGRSENAITVNRAIDDLTKEIKEHYRRIKNSLGFITAEQVKNAVMGVGQKPLTLLALFREHNEEFKKRIGVDRIKESYDSYLRSYKHLSAFVQEKRGIEDVLLRNLDRVFYDDFELFLRTNRNLSPKTVHEHLYRLKKMTMRGCQSGNNTPRSLLSSSSGITQTEKSSSEIGRSEDTAYNPGREATASVCPRHVHFLHLYRTCLCRFEKD